MQEKYLTVRAVAKILGITPLTLRNWDKKGILTAYRNPANNYRLYRYSEVADFVAAIRSSKAQPGPVQKIPLLVEDDAAAPPELPDQPETYEA